MWKAALAGAVALATAGLVSVSHQGIGVAPAAAQDTVVSEGQIARLKSVLRLTAAQEVHWYAVEATLRSLAQQQFRVASADSGFVGRTQARMAGYTLTATAMHRLKSVAQPLINSLNDDQKHDGMRVLQSMGIWF